MSACYLNNSEWEALKSLMQVLQPFYEATKLLSGRKYPTLPYAKIVMSRLLMYLETEDDSDDSFRIGLKLDLFSMFGNYYDKLSKDQLEITNVRFNRRIFNNLLSNIDNCPLTLIRPRMLKFNSFLLQFCENINTILTSSTIFFSLSLKRS